MLAGNKVTKSAAKRARQPVGLPSGPIRSRRAVPVRRSGRPARPRTDERRDDPDHVAWFGITVTLAGTKWALAVSSSITAIPCAAAHRPAREPADADRAQPRKTSVASTSTETTIMLSSFIWIVEVSVYGYCYYPSQIERKARRYADR